MWKWGLENLILTENTDGDRIKGDGVIYSVKLNKKHNDKNGWKSDKSYLEQQKQDIVENHYRQRPDAAQDIEELFIL